MNTEYVGSAVLHLGTNEVEATKIDVKDNTGKKPVKTMNRTRHVKGFTHGVDQYDITFTAVVSVDDMAVDWVKIGDTKIGLVPDVEGAHPTPYLNFRATEAGDNYTMDNELMVDMTGLTTRKVLG